MSTPATLVLGATGRIGAILRAAWAPGDALWQARPGAAPRGASGAADPWVIADPLADAGALERAGQGIDTVLCLAGVTNVAAAAGADIADNIRLGTAAVRLGAALGARVLLASSAAVYGSEQGLLREDRALAPLSDYGRAKAEMEAEGARLGQDLGVAVTALRIGNIAGLDAILGGWRPGFTLDRFADGRTPRRSYIGVATLARVLARLVSTPGLPPVLNVAAPGTVGMGALLDAAGLAWTPRPAGEGAIPEVALDVARLAAFHPFAPEDSLPAAMVAEWRATGQGRA